MTLPREEVLEGLANELQSFEQLVRSLNDEQWRTPTRCEGWKVSDIVSHVVATMTEVVEGRAGDLGAPGSVERLVEQRRGRSARELADELAKARQAATAIMATLDDELWTGPAPGDVAPTMGDGVEALWYDTYVHIQDIRAALGLPAERGPGLRASVSHLAALLDVDGWGPATIAVDGFEEFPVGQGGGRRVEGDPLEFVLAATGRGDPTQLGLDESVNVYRPR